MKSIAEINAQNEEFLNKIIGESEFNSGNEHIPTEEEKPDGTLIPESDLADPTECELDVTLSYGEHLKMGFTTSVMDSLKEQIDDIRAMVNQLHEMVCYIYADDQIDTIENIANDIMSNEDFSIPMEKYTCIEDRKLRLMLMIHDATIIYTSIMQVVSEKSLMENVFKTVFNGALTPINLEEENEEDENNTAEDNNSESSNGNEAE